ILFSYIPFPTLLAFLTLPEALELIRIINTSEDPTVLHPAQGRTARLHGRFGLLMVAGWLIWLIARSILHL
ncbi:MAG TPA: hypothetical protein VHL11_09535, partial [Phototrophicaceae bacterium]|nr:hypothetical protein [Phototrophicaceae bacterium]